MRREATISADGLYRYDLTRTVQLGCMCARCQQHYMQWRAPTAPSRPGYVLWVLCNPSTADAETDDPTERRGWGFTNRWGFGKFVFVNTNPFRSTDPKLVRLDEQALAANDEVLMHHAQAASVVVCAWGLSTDRALANRAERVLRSIRGIQLYALDLSKNGTPKHPLYIKEDTFLKPYT